MLVSPVKFSGTSFQDKINQPQSFVKSDAPVASTGINNSADTESSTGAKVAGAAALTAITATALALIAKKTELLKPAGDGIIQKAKGYLQTAGETIADKAIALKNSVLSLLPGKATVETAEKAAENTAKDAAAAA